MARPGTLFGGALIGTSFTTPAQVQELLDQLKLLGVDRIDTAARYSPTSPGASERLLGQVEAAKQGFTIDTKLNTEGPSMSDGSGSLSSSAIVKSIHESYGRLGMDRVNTLYFHRPDPSTPVEEQAAEIHRQYLAGRFDKFGLSNFSPEQVAEFIAVCENKGYVKPSVYQGLYNLLDYTSHRTLFPLLREHGIAFNAYRFVFSRAIAVSYADCIYSPLAGGFLTGRPTRGDVAGTRYAPDNKFSARMNAMYDKPEMHAAMTDLLDTIEPLQITGSEACLRWLYYHSILQEGDGVILGASKISQITQNLGDISKGPLPAEVVQKIEALRGQLG
ncbi:hypothetical protein N7492_007323 [Penicillium capsulatum]|uniref:NADP-dependent oxidoreductase domain-containing protein n=1 Tax=Penicillium capsulatum TaxID=69766 RepID=A0A9W9I234_9EURO|nr:hypothetical protein N7492_007323 [Penicillium capsulatum]